MLSYLVTSRARRTLLKALWLDDSSAPVSELARASRLAFATAHRELAAMERAGLAVAERAGGALVYRAAGEHPQADLLRSLLRLDRQSPEAVREPARLPHGIDERAVFTRLREMGAPLPPAGGPAGMVLRAEEALAGALVLAHRDPTLARALPVAIHRWAGMLDFARLTLLAKRLGEGEALGLFLDLTAELSGRRDLRKQAAALRDGRRRKPRDFFPAAAGKFATELARRNTPPLARKWHFRMNLGMDGFETLFRRHAGTNAPVQP